MKGKIQKRNVSNSVFFVTKLKEKPEPIKSIPAG